MEEHHKNLSEISEECFTMENLWSALRQMEGQALYTARGLEFHYEIKGNEIFVDRKVNSKSITRSSVEIAFRMMQNRLQAGEKLPLLVTGPKKLGIFGASYLYPIFMELGIIRGKKE